jgi:hypothetical protein
MIPVLIWITRSRLSEISSTEIDDSDRNHREYQMTQQISIKILFPWLMFWFIGWAVQRRHFYEYAHMSKRSDTDIESQSLRFKRYLHAPWYWRLLLGYRPHFGIVSLHPAVFQFLISVTIIAQLLCMLVWKVPPDLLAQYDPLWFIVLLAVGASVSAYWSRKRERKFEVEHHD